MLSATQSATSTVKAAFFVRGTTDDVDDESLLEHAVSTKLAAVKTPSFFIRARFMLAPLPKSERSFTPPPTLVFAKRKLSY